MSARLLAFGVDSSDFAAAFLVVWVFVAALVIIGYTLDRFEDWRSK